MNDDRDYKFRELYIAAHLVSKQLMDGEKSPEILALNDALYEIDKGFFNPGKIFPMLGDE